MGQTVISVSVGTIMGDRRYGQAILVSTLDPNNGKPPTLRSTDRGGYPSCGDGPYWSLTQRPISVRLTEDIYPDRKYGSFSKGTAPITSVAEVTPDHYVSVTYRADLGVTQGTCNMLECVVDDQNNTIILNHFYIYALRGREDRTSEVFQALLNGNGTHRIVAQTIVLKNGKVTPQARDYLSEVIEWEYAPYTGALSNNFFNYTSEGIVGREVASLLQTAYIQAMNDVPRISCNMTANVIDAVDGLLTMYKSLRKPVKALRNLLKNSADPRKSWLSYRYQYNTTKADINEIKAFYQRVRDLKGLYSQEIIVSSTVSSGTLTVKCSSSLKIKDILPTIPADFGFSMDLYNSWDMVPYSFVVDWFLPIGDMLEELRKYSNAMEIIPNRVWYAVHDELGTNHAYMRFSGGRLDVLPTYAERSVSDKTIVYRCADAVALFTH